MIIKYYISKLVRDIVKVALRGKLIPKILILEKETKIISYVSN